MNSSAEVFVFTLLAHTKALCQTDTLSVINAVLIRYTVRLSVNNVEISHCNRIGNVINQFIAIIIIINMIVNLSGTI